MFSNQAVTSPRNRGFLSLTYLFYFAQIGVFVSYVGVFLDDKGFSSEQIGILVAVVSIARIIGPNLWAGLADKTGQIGRIISLGSLLAFITFLFVFISTSFVAYLIVFSVMMMFWTAILPQLEVTAVHACATGKRGYGAIRLWGSIGFIIASMSIGFLLDYFPSDVIVIGATLTLLGLYTSSLLISAPTKSTRQNESKASIWPKLLTRTLIAFLLANMLLQISFGSFYSFFSLYTQSLGYTGWQTGVFMATGVLAEIFIHRFRSKNFALTKWRASLYKTTKRM